MIKLRVSGLPSSSFDREAHCYTLIMNSGVGLTKENLAWISLCGMARGISVHTLIYPLEVVKIRQQCSQGKVNSIRLALTLFRQEGIGSFYEPIPIF